MSNVEDVKTTKYWYTHTIGYASKKYSHVYFGTLMILGMLCVSHGRCQMHKGIYTHIWKIPFQRFSFARNLGGYIILEMFLFVWHNWNERNTFFKSNLVSNWAQLPNIANRNSKCHDIEHVSEIKPFVQLNILDFCPTWWPWLNNIWPPCLLETSEYVWTMATYLFKFSCIWQCSS